MNILIILITYTAINAIAITTAWLLTENIGTRIADLHPILNRKPFNCKPCTTFWLTLTGQTIFAYTLGSWGYFLCGIITAFVIFWKYYNEDKNSIE
ncbi:hypothetical protein [Dysgonomonas sp. 520]|uniref:hypothetical protein n=1 Tax=Dysgonomonas sp. 520 TaxID=2302931 RepID=UPI0013D02E15|nr:hypothetical protein [Dysgonomonas sp. 520]NDW10695.1 hypothetical protein [Dysgonomonas sp. 520]